MRKFDYIDALRRALGGLPPATVAKTLAYYEQRFIDGLAAGLSEDEIAAGLDDPKKIAVTLRASIHMQAFEQQRHPFNVVRVLVSALGLGIFNMFMVVPALVYAALLASLHVAALCLYVAGIAITASGLSGANELVLDGPIRHFVSSEDWSGISDKPMQTRVSISEGGIHVFQEPLADERGASASRAAALAGADAAREAASAARETANAAAHDAAKAATGAAEAATAATEAATDAADAGAQAAEAAAQAAADADAAVATENRSAGRSPDVVERAEALAGSVVRISTDMDGDSRTTQTVIGMALVVGGIVLFLIGLVVGRYTVIGLKRYLAMNLSLLKGN